MIKSFACVETEKIFNHKFSTKLDHKMQRNALKKLVMLHVAKKIDDLRIPPNNQLEKLKGELKDSWSIRINNQWRICFKWEDNNAYLVKITDYH